MNKWLFPDEMVKLEHVEVCPQAVELTENIEKRISSDGGGTLIIDHGQNRRMFLVLIVV